MTVYINGTTGYSGPVGLLGDLTTTGNTILGDASTDTLNVGNGNLVLDSSGNAGLGVTPSAWAGFKVLQIATGFSAWSSGTSNARINANTYYNGGYKYVGTGTATQYEQDGYHAWYNAPSGTAGNAITFTQAMTLDASGNLGIGTTSPTTKLSITDSAGPVIRMIRTSNRFEVSADTDFMSLNARDASTYITFKTADTERARINSSGQFMVGTTTPLGSPATFYGSTATVVISQGSASSYAGLRIYNDANSSGRALEIDYYGTSAGERGEIFCTGAYPLLFGTSNTERARIDSSGRFGLGMTPSGSYSLQIYGVGAAAGSARIRLNNSSTGTADADGGGIAMEGVDLVIQNSENGVCKWEINGSERMRLDASGNLGVGTTSPDSIITFSGNITSKSSDSYGIGTNGGNNHFNVFATGASGAVRFWTGGSSATSVGGGGTERARIDSSGNFLFSCTDPSGSVSGIKLRPNGVETASTPRFDIVGSASTVSNTIMQAYSTGAAAYRFYVQWNGQIYASQTTISGISDVRYKENIVDLDVGLDAIMALKPRKFDWKKGKGKDIKGDRGFIAQEFEEVFPDLIDQWKDPAPEGEEPYKSVKQELIPVLVKAIQEQQAIIQQLQADVAALKGAV